MSCIKKSKLCSLSGDRYIISGQKLDYFNNNPVRSMGVENPEEYIFSSAKDYGGANGLVESELLH